MNAQLAEIFLINLGVTALCYLVFLRGSRIPAANRFVILVAFLVSPIFLAVEGAVSAIYAADLLSPLIFVIAFRGWKRVPQRNKRLFLLFVLLLIGLPLFGTATNFVMYGSSSTQFSERNLQWLLIWIFRNAIYLSLLAIAMSQRVQVRDFITHLKFILVLSGGLSVLGIIDYSGLKDLSAYEMIAAANSVDSAYYTTRTTIGWGYMGMFRGSVGQFWANVFCLSLPFIIGGSRSWRFIGAYIAVASVALVLCSLSRAGIIGVVAAVICLAYLTGVRGFKFVFPAGIAAIVLWPLVRSEAVWNRLLTIGGFVGGEEVNRVGAWQVALDQMGHDISLLLFGNGAANREGVAQLIGAYGAHNEYLDAVFRAGILGLICLIVLLFALWSAYSRRLRKVLSRRKMWLAVIPAILFSNAVMGLSQDHLYREYSGYAAGLLLYFLYGLGLSFWTKERNAPSSSLDQTLR